MTEIESDKVKKLVLDLCNRAKGQLPQGAAVTMIVRMPWESGTREEFIITNDRDPLALMLAIAKWNAGDHPDVVSDIKVPIEPIRGGEDEQGQTEGDSHVARPKLH
jgi:hypothetical protein